MGERGKATLKNSLITLCVMFLSFGVSLLLQEVLAVEETIATVFVFGAFLVSFLTDGYVYGIASAFVGVFAVNFAFTFPYFAFSFSMPENFISALVMIVISLVTSTLTTKHKYWQQLKAESERERMRANLLRAVSHDLRTPLTTIYGASSAILENGEALTEENRVRMITGIKEDSEWLIRMVENLLSITRIDTGRVEIIKTPTVLDELIDSVLLKFKKRYTRWAVDVTLPDEMVLIPMDAILIEQVIVNLLENAVQHAEGMTRLSLSVSLEGKKATFEVRDDGCGIEKEKLERIFSGYYDSFEESSDKEKRNSGIGLSVCSTIVKAHGGKIYADNHPEGGAVFRFSLDVEEGIEDDEQ